MWRVHMLMQNMSSNIRTESDAVFSWLQLVFVWGDLALE